MTEQLRLDEARGIVIVDSSGKISLEQIRETMEKVLALCAERGFHKTLVDARKQDGLPSITELYEIASNIPRDIRVALLGIGGGPNEDGLRFLETVAKNTGLEVRVFFEEDEALRWLAQ